MAESVGVLVYGGYHELEFWYPVLRLREAEIPVSVLGVEGDVGAVGASECPGDPFLAGMDAVLADEDLLRRIEVLERPQEGRGILLTYKV